MEITILGWYGTETIGDRAILAGIFRLLSNSFGDLNINLGSLYPFFSQRTLTEDTKLWKETLKINVRVNLFDSKNISELDKNITKSDMVIMGGGPLMQVEPLYMIRYAFKKAKQLGRKTVIFGCGVGPLVLSEYQICLMDIIDFSDLVILRDSISRNNLYEIARVYKRKVKGEIFTSIDPSVVVCLAHKNVQRKNNGNYIAINLRSFPGIYSERVVSGQINENLTKLISDVCIQNKNTTIRLIPMHYFYLGGDDREFLNLLVKKLKRNNLFVQDDPLTVSETMTCFQNATQCYGMRFHSIIFQTLLNGNNYILDYTKPKVGKISGFLNDIDENGFYRDRYINLQESTDYEKIVLTKKGKFKVPEKLISKTLEVYKNEVTKLLD